MELADQIRAEELEQDLMNIHIKYPERMRDLLIRQRKDKDAEEFYAACERERLINSEFNGY